MGLLVLVADDVQLVRAAQAGDVAAFEELVRRHELGVFRVALRMLGSEADAQDAAQDAFVQAWRALASFRAESAFSTWLYRIVTNGCLAMLASPNRPSTQLSGAEVDPRPGPEAIAIDRDELDAVKGAILELTPEQRAPLVLREFEGLSYDEIGEVLDLAPGAVKGRLHRGRLELVRRMRQWS